MLSNALNMLIYWAARQHSLQSNKPVFFLHPLGGQVYQIIMQKVPDSDTLNKS